MRSIRHMYIINYGNGQVSGTFTRLEHARNHLLQCDGYAYIERWDSGEYFPCDKQTGHFLDMTLKKNKRGNQYA